MNIVNKLKLSNEVTLYLLLYILAYGLILLNLDFIYWDDWVLVNQTKEDLVGIFEVAGNPLTGYYHYVLLEFFGIYAYKILTFATYFVSGLMVNNILKTIKNISTLERITLVSVFLLFPSNFARIALIDSPYAFYNMVFFIAFYFFSVNIANNDLKYRVISLVLFFLSFQINSLLVFYLVIFIYFIYQIWKSNSKQYIKKIFQYTDFWILPFIFYIFKTIYLVPQDSHMEYYAITKAKIISSFFYSCKAIIKFYMHFFELLPSHVYVVILILVFIAIIYIVKKLNLTIIEKNKPSRMRSIVFFSLGIFFLYIGIYPYLVVNTSPSYYDWDSRHFLLFPLGLSFMIMSIFNLFYNTRVKQIMLVGLASVFIAYNISAYYNYIVDGLKQDSILQNMKGNEVVENNTAFIIADRTKKYDALERTYRFYEYGGMLDQIYGGQDKFATQNTRLIQHSVLKNYLVSGFKLKNHIIQDKYIEIIILHGGHELNINNVIKLLFLKIFNNKKYARSVKNIVKLESISND
ncbi:MAG: hypothetical protein QS721_04815 [Candidatus Endonucleobacter sp. (ex Gigantidas childressi)]|nr:hypothetical protein [Candidatus Endonucleobacter sp. (ex Gigantidas childressi)]